MRCVVEAGLRRRRRLPPSDGGADRDGSGDAGAWERELVLYAALNPGLEARRMPVRATRITRHTHAASQATHPHVNHSAVNNRNDSWRAQAPRCSE